MSFWNFFNWQKNGFYIEEDGTFFCNYKDGKKEGVSIRIFELERENPIIQEVVKQLRKGIVTLDTLDYKKLLGNGLMEVCHWHDGELHGPVQFFYSNGFPYFEGNFDRGLQTGLYREYREGQLAIECFYKEDKLEGIFREYQNGQIVREEVYHNGKRLSAREAEEYFSGLQQSHKPEKISNQSALKSLQNNQNDKDRRA